MRLKIILIIILSPVVLSDNYFFYYFDSLVIMTPVNNSFMLKIKEHEVERLRNEISVYAHRIDVFKTKFPSDVYLILQAADDKKNIMSDYLSRNHRGKHIAGFRGSDNVIHFPTGEVIVKFKQNVSLSSIRELCRLFKVHEKVKLDEFSQTYVFEPDEETSDNVFEISSKFSLTQFAEFSQPNFIRSGMLLELSSFHQHKSYIPDDSLIHYMWHLNNTGSNIPEGIQGIPGCDMRMFEAWNITRGNPNVIIAITDTGIDTNHVDLIPNLTDRRLWYDAIDNDQQPYDEYYHGTGVSGCSSAKGDNQIGTAGIAYNCQVMPVRVFGPYPSAYTTDLILAKGLQWSWIHGASVINCSWGGGVPSPLITNAIRNAARFGRSGRGTVVFGGSGNANVEEVIYPASMPEVIGVGGLSPCNQRKSTTSCDNIGGTQNWGACYGEGLSVVAPTTFIGTTTLLGGWCICGNGTSAASPLAAGVGALIISKNINISGDSVKMIIERSARKVGNYSYNILKENGWWNNEMGYGAIDAKAALDMTPQGPQEIYEQIPPIIKIYPPESGVFSSTISVDAEIYDLSGIQTGVNSPRIYYYTIQRNNLQVITGTKIYGDLYRFIFPVIPVSEGFYYYVAAQDLSNVPNVSTYPIGGKGYNPPGRIPPSKFMFVRNTLTYDTILTSTNVPVPIQSFKDTFSILNVSLDKIILDVNCLVNIEHTYDADLIFSLVSPSGTEIVLAGGVGDSGRNFINTEFDDEASVSIDSSLARAPFTGIFKPIDRLWLFDGENALGNWKLRVVDNGISDKGTLLGWSIKFRFSSGSDYVTLPSKFSIVKNYPNPFNPITRIVFNVPEFARVKIAVYDLTGREVRILLDELRSPMLEDFVDFEASGLASGVYFCTMVVDGSFVDSRKIAFVK